MIPPLKEHTEVRNILLELFYCFFVLQNLYNSTILKDFLRWRKNYLTELKHLRFPPPQIRHVMEAINILFGVTPEWYYSKKLLLNANFARMLIEFDKEKINDDILDRLEPYIMNIDCMSQKIFYSSKACFGLWVYVVRMYKYGRAIQEITRRHPNLKQEARKIHVYKKI